LQEAFSEPREETFLYDAGEDGEVAKRGMLTMNWLLGENYDPVTTLGLGILEHILIGTPASPLRKALIDSGLGEDLAGTGLDDEILQMTFSTGLKGIAHEDSDRVSTLILDTLKSLAQEGMEADTVEASMNTIEFRLRENNTGNFPRGISLMARALSTWLYGGDALAPLAFSSPLEAIKKRLADGEPYFERLIQAYLIDNQHRSTIIMVPDPTLRERQEVAERELLSKAKAAMSVKELQETVANTVGLRQLQSTPNSPEALATIPTLTLEDLDKENKLIPFEALEKQDTTILYHDLFTNGIVYLDIGFNLHTLPQELLPYVPLFGDALTLLGTETEDFVTLSQRIGRETGGIWAETLSSAVKDSLDGQVWLVLRAKATVERAEAMLTILRDLLLTLRLDNRERLVQMILEAKARKEARLIPSGHLVVHNRLKSRFDEAGWAAEQFDGVSSLFFLRELIERVESDWPSVLYRLTELGKIMLNRSTMVCNVTLDRDNWQDFLPILTDFLGELPSGQTEFVRWKPEVAPEAEGLTIPARVNYVAKGVPVYDLGYQLHGSINVITNYLATTWLHEQVRVKGGAYGGFCVFDQRSGLFDYISYRDPNLLETLENYDGTGQFLTQLKLTDEELTKGIIGAIGTIDRYMLPDAKGYTSMVRYLVGESDADRQKIRDEVLATRSTDFRNFGSVLERVKKSGLVVAMGSKEAIDEANSARNGWLKVTQVL
jgi:Zn-dependent M16 (insulinase) family peptidase